MPNLSRGLLVIICVLALLFPVISMSDDLSQAAVLAEGNKLQDVLKSPELRGIYIVALILPAVLLPLRPLSESVARNFLTESFLTLKEFFWSPLIEKRPPPQLS